jgi:hypothetical protein
MGKTMLTLSIDRSCAKMRAAAEPAHSIPCSGEIDGPLAAATVQANEEKYCTRCLEARQARYRVYTDVIDLAVCPVCAEEARRLGLSVEQLDRV